MDIEAEGAVGALHKRERSNLGIADRAQAKLTLRAPTQRALQRLGEQGAGVFNAPDLRVELDAVSMCGSSAIRLSAVVTNAGSRGVPAGVPVEFRQTAPLSALVGSEVTSMPLLPGASERITVTVMGVPLGEDLDFEVVVDGEASGVALECNEDNNGATATEMCSLLL